MKVIRPQEGFQTRFLSSRADIVVGGGSAGSGKSFALLLEALRHSDNKKFRAIIFRKNAVEVKQPGGLWDTSQFYSEIGAKSNETELRWEFRSGASVKFNHLEHEKSKYSHQGGQYALIGFDELTHFSETQFFYLLSRNRSVSGVRPYIRATCNPDPDSWVARFIEWFIDQDEHSPNYGYPIKERVGQLRYFSRYQEGFIWGDSVDEVVKQSPHLNEMLELDPSLNVSDLVKSMTFIPGNIDDNPILKESDPSYVANLLSQDESTKAMLLFGNWKVKFDNLGLFHSQRVQDLFTNQVTDSNKKYITCDAARFGRDFCVIMVWQGWKVVKICVYYKTEAFEIVQHIEQLRKDYTIGKSKVLIDQDGVGGGTKSLGGYQGFSGGAAPMKDPKTKEVERYSNLKTQCFYRISERVESSDIQIVISSETCQVEGQYSTKVKANGKVQDIRELIRQDLAAIKRAKPDHEGKRLINTKEQQKAILGRSPDFADTFMMREWFELTRPISGGGGRSWQGADI